MLARVHTALALAAIAAIPLGPLGMWAYARIASADQDAAVAANERVLAQVGPFPGARRLDSQIYERRAWEGESLVPIEGYATETAFRLPRRLPIDELVAYHDRALAGWERSEEAISCGILALPPGCGARYVQYRRGDVLLELNAAEYAEGQGMLREYGVQVSQRPCCPGSA